MTPTPAAPSGELESIAANHDAMLILMQSYPARNVVAVVDAHVKRQVEAALARAAVSQAAPEQATTECALKGAEGLGLCVGSCTKLGYCIERTERARALAAPSGAPKQPQDDYEQLEGMREAVSDFRKAAYEFGKRHDPADQVTMMEAQRRIFTEARNLAAASTVQSAPAKDDADPIGDFQAEDRQAKLDDFVASMQSAPVLPERDKCQFCLGAKGGVRGNENVFNGIIACDYCSHLLTDARPAQSTPVQVEGQQEPQAHVMPPFAAPASQPDARDPNWLLSTMDGKDWADEFCRMNNAADHGMMLGWFCNAIMTGYDTGRRHEADEQSSTAGAAKGGIDEPNGAVQALALPVAAAPEQKP